MRDRSLSLFLPEVQDWFAESMGQASEVQRLAWPKIQSGGNCLISAPTGSGKTLAAFLWFIDRLLRRGANGDNTDRILYVSPLKALNSDIEVNLQVPLRELKARMPAWDSHITVAVRSGDTSSSERRRQERERPDIFITTPESLAILMARASWPGLLTGIGTVIVDEIHSLVDNKRGVMLMALLELLEQRNGPCQRLALSATVRPLETVASWFSGRCCQPDGHTFQTRPIEIVSVPKMKRCEIEIDRPDTSQKEQFSKLGPWLRERMDRQRAVLIFANSRRQVERTVRQINECVDDGTVVAAHHGSLAKEIRQDVEEGFKNGRIKAVVATHSLELGVDIGSVDQVILLGTPFSVASTLQRIGRSGHRVDSTSRGLLVPRHRLDHLYGLVMAEMALNGEIETACPSVKPLDVLAQVLLIYMAAGLDRAEQMLTLLRCAHSFADLTEEEIRQTLDLLAGRLDGQRNQALIARIHYDSSNGICQLRPHARMLVYRASGVIADRGYFTLRQIDGNVKIGELDEEFVWERNPGDLFPFANRLWRFSHRDNVNVWVTAHQGEGGILPFWRAEANDLAPSFCQRLLTCFEAVESGREAIDTNQAMLHCSPVVRNELQRLLDEQRRAWNCLPAHGRIIAEYHVHGGQNGADGNELLLFTFRGGRFNRSLALLLEWLYQKKCSGTLNSLTNNEGIMFRVANASSIIPELLRELDASTLQAAFHDLLPSRSQSAALFREQAQIALIIPRSWAGQRGPLWWRRERSARLMEELGKAERCILLEGCWRESMARHYELPALRDWIGLLRAGRIEQRMTRLDKPSPMAADLIWQHENEMMYKAEAAAPKIKPSWLLLQQTAGMDRVPISAELAEQYLQEKWRLRRGMEPDSPQELRLWLEERRFVPIAIWERMETALCATHREAWDGFTRQAFALYSAKHELIGFCDSQRTVSLLESAVRAEPDPASTQFLLDWLRFFPGLSREGLAQYWAWPQAAVQQLLNSLPADQVSFWDDGHFALNRVIDQLWQRTRTARRQGLDTVDAPGLARFLASWMKRGTAGLTVDERLAELLFRFILLPLPAPVWFGSMLDGLCPDWNRQVLQDVMSRYGVFISADNQQRISFTLADDFFTPAFDSGQLLEPLQQEFARLIDNSIGELSSGDLLQQGLTGSHSEVLSGLRKLFFSGRIVCSQLDGVETLLAADGQKSSGNGPLAARNRFGAKRLRLHPFGPISRGWRKAAATVPQVLSPLERQEAVKEWLRLLLERYGLFFPELLQHESAPAPWPELRTALAQMEWAGELISGHFVRGARYPQYLTVPALDLFSSRESSGWQLMHSAEPSSLCGYQYGLFRHSFPFSRHFGWLVCENGRWGLAIGNRGRKIRFNPHWQTEQLAIALDMGKQWLGKGRRFGPVGQWIVDEVQADGIEPAKMTALLKEAGFCQEMNQWVL